MLNEFLFTSCGIIAVLLWCTNVYFIRLVSDNVGYFAGVGLIFLFSGILGLVIYLKQNNWKFSELTREFMIVCGLFIANNISSSLTTVLSPGGDILLQVTIVSYLWVILLNIFLVTILGYNVIRLKIFYVGNILALLGIIISCTGFNFSKINFVRYFPKYFYCYILALISAFTWSYYSVYLKKWGKEIFEDHIYISMIISGTIMTLLSLASNKLNNFDDISYDFKNIGLFLYEIIIATCLPYYLWNVGYKFGNAKIISNFTLFVPIINIFSTSLFYGYDLFNDSMYGAIILIVAIACCKNSIESNDEIDSDIEPNLREPLSNIDNISSSQGHVSDIVYDCDGTIEIV